MDATKELIARFSDPTQWDRIDEGVPIFTEHTAYAILTDDGKIKLDKGGRPILEIVMPGCAAPKNSKVFYTVDAERVKKVADNINATLKDFSTPIKNFIGHSDPSKPQTEQPPLVGYSVGATVAPWGPQGRATIFSKVFVEKDCKKSTKGFVQRSPEFYPTKDTITGLALLKTDPRLPMGMVPYGEEGPVFYSKSFEAYAFPPPKAGGAPQRPQAPMPQAGPPQEDDEDPTVNPGEIPGDDDTDDYDPGPGDDDQMELNPDEAKTAMRYMAHYERHHPVIKYACDQYRSMQNQGQPPAKGQEQMHMSQTITPVPLEVSDLPVEYQQLPQKLTEMEKMLAESQVRYAVSEATRIVDGLILGGWKIKDRKKEIERMTMLDDKGRLERESDIRENYQQVEQDPTRGPMVQVYSGSVEGADGKVDYYGRDLTDDQMQAMVAYAEKNDLDMEDEDDLKKIREAVAKK